MKKSFAFIVLLLAQSLSMCIKSERYICMKDLEEESLTSPVHCYAGYPYFENRRLYYESIGNMTKADEAAANRDVALYLCVEYLVEYEKCSHKSTIKPANIEL